MTVRRAAAHLCRAEFLQREPSAKKTNPPTCMRRTKVGSAGTGNDAWQRHRAAKKLGISRRTLHRKINEMNEAKIRKRRH